jgi:alpha-beta hydrolase superfamily lysophospholipase
MASSYQQLRKCKWRKCSVTPRLHNLRLTSVDATQILQGQKDTRVEPEMSEQFHKDAAATDKTLLKYEEGYHQLLPDTPEVVERAKQDLGKWFLEHV